MKKVIIETENDKDYIVILFKNDIKRQTWFINYIDFKEDTYQHAIDLKKHLEENW